MTRNIAVFRVVTTAWLAGWFYKSEFFVMYLFGEVFGAPIRYDLFPGPLLHPVVSAVAWALPAIALGAVVFPRQRVMRAAAVLMATASLVACVHLETCSDATFVTSFWVALWLVWFTHHAHRTDERFRRHARLLARSVVALVFFGAFVGKLTPEYTGGEAFHELYFVSREEWPYPSLREALAPDALRRVATHASRAAIAVEGLCAALPLMPHRIGVAVGGVAMLGMIAVTTFYLFSVVGCLLGLLGATLLLGESTVDSRRSTAPESETGG